MAGAAGLLLLATRPVAAAGAQGPEPELHIRIKLILVTDNQSQARVEATSSDVARWLDGTNAIFKQAGLRVTCEVPRDFSVLADTAVLREATRRGALSKRQREEGDEMEHLTGGAHLAAAAAAAPGRLVCLLAITPEISERVVDHDIDGMKHVIVQEQSGKRHIETRPAKRNVEYHLRMVTPFAEYASLKSGEPRYVVMTGWTGVGLSFCRGAIPFATWQVAAFAHEIGHYLGLAHTFPRAFGKASQAERYAALHGGTTAAFDGDRLPDTEPDACISANRCDPPGTEITVGNLSLHVSDNLMSYSMMLGGSAARLSPRQVAIMRSSVQALGLDPRHLESGALERLVTTVPDHAEARCERGRRRFAQGRLDAAIEDWRAAIKLRPSFFEAYIRLGVALLLNGDAKTAGQIFDNALLLNPESPSALLGRAASKAAAGDAAGAGADLDAARTIDDREEERWEDDVVLGRHAINAAGSVSEVIQALQPALGGPASAWARLAARPD